DRYEATLRVSCGPRRVAFIRRATVLCARNLARHSVEYSREGHLYEAVETFSDPHRTPGFMVLRKLLAHRNVPIVDDRSLSGCGRCHHVDQPWAEGAAHRDRHTLGRLNAD